MGKLCGGDLMGGAKVVKKFCGDEGRGWDAAGSLFLRAPFERIGIDVHLVFKEFWTEDMEICSVAEGIKSFIRVFDCQLDNCWVVRACSMDGCVQMSTMSRALMRRKDQELSNP
jgi:hypothetical protein